MSREADWLVDTNILIHVLRGSPLGRHVVDSLKFRARDRTPLLSVVSQGELFSFARHNRWGKQKLDLLEELLNELVIVDVVATSRVLHEAYAELDALGRPLGRKMGKNDLWIAATAAVNGALLLTTDKDFDHLSPAKLSVWWFDPDAQHWPSVPS